ncbi:MAG: nitrous oxide-stimulated promoter family protein [Eggerthellaceae bacterium]|nr:nitrous oxide-stimulated promoter family protein [Eggerthellaceae bacterium]
MTNITENTPVEAVGEGSCECLTADVPDSLAAPAVLERASSNVAAAPASADATAPAAPASAVAPAPSSRRAAADPPAVARRRAREECVISQMVALYCAGNHDAASRTERACCGELVCPACKAVDAYAVLRTARCRQMHAKTSCEKCPYHCYRPQEREQIRQVMRYAGPRMLTKHPIAAIRHLLGR